MRPGRDASEYRQVSKADLQCQIGHYRPYLKGKEAQIVRQTHQLVDEVTRLPLFRGRSSRISELVRKRTTQNQEWADQPNFFDVGSLRANVCIQRGTADLLRRLLGAAKNPSSRHDSLKACQNFVALRYKTETNECIPVLKWECLWSRHVDA